MAVYWLLAILGNVNCVRDSPTYQIFLAPLLDEVIDPVLETPLFLAVMYLHFAFALVVLGAALRSILTSAQPPAQQSDPHPSDDVLTPASDPPPISTLLKVIG